MPFFCGQDKCLMDNDGRVRLNSRHVEAFFSASSGEIFIHGLPEGALAVYPSGTYHEIRKRELSDVGKLSESIISRRSLRRFGALTLPGKVTNQGRISIPEEFREYAGLTPGEPVMIIGAEIGVEIWNIHRFEEEMNAINLYWHQKDRAEINDSIGMAANFTAEKGVKNEN